jgi:FtsH-binding integral membrane protein
MADDTSDPMTNAWKSQPAEPVDLSLEDMRRKAQKLETKVWWRNVREYVACALVVAAFGYYAAVFDSTLIRAGCGLVIVGALVAVFRLHQAGAARPVPAELALRTCAGFQRRELERQRDLLLGVWRWYLLPFVPGLVVFLLGLFEFTMRQPHASERSGTIAVVFALTAAGCALVFAGVGKANQWAARRLQREIDALDRLVKEPATEQG